jgi:hypothetical protein
MLQFHCVVLSEWSCDSLMGQGERASVERRIAAGHLQDAVGLSDKNIRSWRTFRLIYIVGGLFHDSLCLLSVWRVWIKICQAWQLMNYPPLITSATLSPMACVVLRTSAVAIRASSCVNLSNLFSASSISVLPISFFPNVSKHRSVNRDIVVLNHSLILPCLISLVAIPRIEKTSTTIWMIVSIISVVGGTCV